MNAHKSVHVDLYSVHLILLPVRMNIYMYINKYMDGLLILDHGYPQMWYLYPYR